MRSLKTKYAFEFLDMSKYVGLICYFSYINWKISLKIIENPLECR